MAQVVFDDVFNNPETVAQLDDYFKNLENPPAQNAETTAGLPEGDPKLPYEEEFDAAASEDGDDGEVTPPPAEPGEMEQKYNTLRGKYDAETKRLREKVAMLESAVGKLSQAEDKPKAVPEQQKPVDPLEGIDLSKYNPEQLKIVKAISEQVALTQVKNLEAEISKLKESVGKESIASFESQLSGKVTDLKSITSMPEFKEFLDDVHPDSGFQNRMILQNAFESRNFTAAVSLFDRFKKANGIETTGKQPQVSPGKSRPAVEVSGDKIVINEQTINQHYQRVRSGYYKQVKGGAELEKRIENAIARVLSGKK